MRSRVHPRRPFSPPRSATGHLHGANMTAPSGVETRDLLAPASRARVPRGPRSSSSSAPPVSPWTCCLGAGQRGPTPLSLLRRPRRRSGPRPSAAPLCWPRGPGNSQMGRYHPLRGRRGGLTGAPPPRPPQQNESRATPRWEPESAAAARGSRGRSVPPPPRPHHPPPRPARWFAPRRTLGPAGLAPSARARAAL